MLDSQLTKLILTDEGIQALNGLLERLLAESGAKYVLLVEKSGQKITSVGENTPNEMALAALVAGAFASTREIAKLLGEQVFKMMIQKGEHDNIFISLLETEDLLTVVFDEKTTLGMVKLKTSQMTPDISGEIEKMSQISKKMNNESNN